MGLLRRDWSMPKRSLFLVSSLSRLSSWQSDDRPGGRKREVGFLQESKLRRAEISA